MIQTTATATDPRAFFEQEGYYVASELFSPQECSDLIDHFMRMHKTRALPNYPYADERTEIDPLKIYTRVMHPHRFDATSLRWLLDPRIADLLRTLLGEEPLATQSMFYYKPPGARGQAFHQDNYYLRVSPKTCIAAWVALEKSSVENGGLQVVPGTQGYPLQCPEAADEALSFTSALIRPPEGHEALALDLEAGDVLFFNGSVVHGSTPNNSKSLWRRSFICHYAPTSMQAIHQGYFPLLDMQGNVAIREAVLDGGPCGLAGHSCHYHPAIHCFS